MAKAVGVEGRVYAADIDEVALKYIEDSARKESLPQLKPVKAEESDPRIPEPVNVIAIIDFTERWPKAFEHKKYTVTDLDKWMAAAGLTRTEKHDFIENHFFAIYQLGSR